MMPRPQKGSPGIITKKQIEIYSDYDSKVIHYFQNVYSGLQRQSNFSDIPHKHFLKICTLFVCFAVVKYGLVLSINIKITFAALGKWCGRCGSELWSECRKINQENPLGSDNVINTNDAKWRDKYQSPNISQIFTFKIFNMWILRTFQFYIIFILILCELMVFIMFSYAPILCNLTCTHQEWRFFLELHKQEVIDCDNHWAYSP